MYSRFKVENFFVTTITTDISLTSGVDGIIPVQELPTTIEDGKLFYVIFKIDDKDNRFSLPVYIENHQLKYKGYNVTQNYQLKKYDTVGMNDLAENFNYVFKNIDDIGTIVKKGGLDVLVYGGILVNGGETLDVADTTITLDDNTLSHIIFDFSDGTLKAVADLAEFGQYHFADITTAGGEITDIVLKKSFNVGEFFSTAFFTRNEDGAVIIKDGSISKAKMDLTGVTADDIDEGTEHLLMTPEERQTLNTVDSKSHTHANKSVLDTITEADRTKLNNTSGHNTGDETQMTIKTKLGQASGSDDGYLGKSDWVRFNNKQDAINDLQTIREGAAKGSTAVQPATLNGYQTKANMRTTLNNPDHEHYPTTKAVVDKLTELGAGDMMKDIYDPNRKETDAFDYNNLDNTPTIPSTAADVNALPDSTKYGATFELSLNPTTYVITATLKDQDGNALGTPATVDLPLESVVVSGSYDAEHEKIVLTLENGQTIDIPVSSLVSGLQAEITSLNMLDADLVDDSNSTNKFVTAAEKSAWNAKGDMNYSDFNFETKTGASITLDLSSEITPSENFTVNAPATIKDGQIYLLRVTNGVTVYTMSLGSNVINPDGVDTILSSNAIDIFAFLGRDNKLELLPQTLTNFDIALVSNVYAINSNSDLTNATKAVVSYLGDVTPPSILYNGRLYTISNSHTSTNIGFTCVDDSDNGSMLYWIEIAFSYQSGNPVATQIFTGSKTVGAGYNAGTGITILDGDDYSAMQGPCPNGFHVPTSNNWQQVLDILTALSIDISNTEKYLKLHNSRYVGHRDINGNFISGNMSSVQAGLYYWTSTKHNNTQQSSAFYITTYASQRSITGMDRANGCLIRPFKDVSISPDNSFTTIYDGSSVAEGAGIFYSSTLGVISLSSDGINWITIADKNLGATVARNDGDAISAANVGKFYQWGNNYGFDRGAEAVLTTDSTQVDASTYGPGNYYNSSTYIIGSNDWSSVRNDDLWGGETGYVTHNNEITNTGVLSVNGQTGNVIVNDTKKSSTAPSNPVQGDLWYDTTNDVLKSYNGTNWNAVGNGDVSGPSSATDSHVALFDGATGKLLKDGGALPIPTVVSGDVGVTYTIKSGTAKPVSGTPNTTITIVLDS